MSYDQTFKGQFEYADAHCLEAGLDRFAARLADSIVDLDSLKIDGLTVVIDMDCSAPASMYDETTWALRELGSEAKSGSVTATFTMDGTDRERIRSGGRSRSNGLPPQHHRWALFFAAKAGDASGLRALIERGIAMDHAYEGYYGWSPLHLAAKAGAAEAVTVLLQAGVSPDIASPSGTTPLAVASNAEVARRLLAAGADKDRAVDDSVAIAIAYDHDRWEVADVLLEAGAKIPESACKGILESLARGGQLGGIQRLVRREPAITKSFTEPELMEAAIAGGDAVLVDYLLEHGAKLPQSFLEAAIRSGSLALAETALRLSGSAAELEHGLSVAADDCDLPMMQLLARHGAPLQPSQPERSSPLHIAARSWADNAVECLQWLLDSGAPINAVNSWGATPLQVAAEYLRTPVVVLLLERGADRSALERLSTSDRAALRKAMGAKWDELVGAKKAKKAAAKKPAAKKKTAAKKKPAAKKKAAKKKSR